MKIEYKDVLVTRRKGYVLLTSGEMEQAITTWLMTMHGIKTKGGHEFLITGGVRMEIDEEDEG